MSVFQVIHEKIMGSVGQKNLVFFFFVCLFFLLNSM